MLNETITNTASTMREVSAIVTELERKGYLVRRIIVSDTELPVIMLFKNDMCENLIRTGLASYQYLGNRESVKQGRFMYKKCQCVWPESIY